MTDCTACDQKVNRESPRTTFTTINKITMINREPETRLCRVRSEGQPRVAAYDLYYNKLIPQTLLQLRYLVE